MAERRLGIYMSHSWKSRDVDLNVRVWEEFAPDCELLVDKPEEPGADPPYYINRIEELLQRADLFLSILTYRNQTQGDSSGVSAGFQCSPYSLFEVRLAELADIPRLILYERTTLFKAPRIIRPLEAYIDFNRGVKDRLSEPRQWTNVIQPKIQQWKTWAANHYEPISYEQSYCAALIGFSQFREAGQVLKSCLDKQGYELLDYEPAGLGSSETFRKLREIGLIIAEFDSQDALFDQIYAAAHALGIPSIRMLRGNPGEVGLPWILRGGTGGYQDDIVFWTNPDDIPSRVNPRIAAMSRLSPALRDTAAFDYLQSKRYSQFFVFISHNLKASNRTIVDELFSLLNKQHITPFEYEKVNTVGIDWRTALKDALQKTTHLVVLLSPDYEQSQTCTYELETCLERRDKVTFLPFRMAGRTAPHPKLGDIQNVLLEGKDIRADARIIAEQITSVLDQALVKAEQI